MLEALETLGLVAGTDDQLSGPIPAELGQLSSLVGLYLENIRLSRQERAIFAQQMTDRSGCETQACCKPENRPAISKKYAKKNGTLSMFMFGTLKVHTINLSLPSIVIFRLLQPLLH